MNLKKRADRNQPEIVESLRGAGCAICYLHTVGAGCPDILVSIDDQVFLIEIKDGAKPPSAQALTPAQVKWHAEWKAKVHIVNSVAAALAVVAIYKKVTL